MGPMHVYVKACRLPVSLAVASAKKVQFASATQRQEMAPVFTNAIQTPRIRDARRAIGVLDLTNHQEMARKAIALSQLVQAKTAMLPAVYASMDSSVCLMGRAKRQRVTAHAM